MAASTFPVEVREGLPNKGRGLFSLQTIAKGSIIFEERPLVSAQFLWNALYRYQACDHCMRSLETAEAMARRLSDNPALVLPFPECCQVKPEEHTVCPHCQVLYCCTACRDTAWKQYHCTLCMGSSSQNPEHPLAKLQEAWRNVHYPPETASIMLIARMISVVRQSSNREDIIAKFCKFTKATVNEEQEIAHKLLGKEFQSPLELMRCLLSEALFEEDLKQWFTPEGFQSLFALIGTNGQGIGTSSLSVWVKATESLELSEEDQEKLESFLTQMYQDIENIAGTFLNCEGAGLYELQSASNHSCIPNAEVTFPHNDFTLAMRATRNIEAGEEICISYLDECELERSRHSRQKYLRENYLFNCDCAKCADQAEDPDITSSEEEDEEDMDEEDEEDDL